MRDLRLGETHALTVNDQVIGMTIFLFWHQPPFSLRSLYQLHRLGKGGQIGHQIPSKGRWPMCWLWLQTSACGNRILCNLGWMPLRGVCPHLHGSAFPPVSAARANGSMIGRCCNCRSRMVGLGRFWCGAASKRSQSAL